MNSLTNPTSPALNLVDYRESFYGGGCSRLLISIGCRNSDGSLCPASCVTKLQSLINQQRSMRAIVQASARKDVFGDRSAARVLPQG